MSVSVTIAGDSQDLLDLEASLRVDPGLRGTALARSMRPPAADEMGPVTEALAWTAASADLLSALAGVLTAWLSSRRSTVRIRIGDREVEIESTRIPDPTELALTLLRAAEAGTDV